MMSPEESTYVSGEIVDGSEEDTISFSDEDAQKYFEEVLYPGGRRRRKSDPPAIFVFTPEETEIVMALDSRHRSRRASEVYNVASEEEDHHSVEDTVLSFTERYKIDNNFVAVENNNCWTTVEEVAMNMERNLRNRRPEETKSPVKKTSPWKSSPFSPRKSAPKTLANAAIESPRKSPKKSPKNSPKRSPKNSPSAPKKLLPEILESSVQTYRPVYHVNLDNTNLVPVPYTPRYSENSTTATFRVPVAAPRSFLTKKVTTPVEEKTRKEDEWSKPKESKDTRGRIKKTQRNAQKYEEKTVDVKQSPQSQSKMNFKDCLNSEKDVGELQDEEQENNNSVASEVQKPSRPNSLVLGDTFHDGKGIKADNMAATRVTSFTSSDDSSDSREVVVVQRRRRLSLELDADESLALSTLEAVVMEGPKSSALYSCSNQPFNSFEELEAMKDKHLGRAHDADAKPSRETISPERKLSDGTHHTEDTDDLDCVVNLPSLDDSLTDDRLDSLPSDQEGGERCNTSSMMSDYTLSRDSLEGFLSDDIKSLRSFVAQRNLDISNLPEEPKRKEEIVEDSSGQNSEKREDSIDFTFEEVDDSPSHFATDWNTEEKRTSKRSPKLSRFTQKVSDKNKENEEKSKVSSFRPRNILLFGSKDKNKMKDKPKPSGNDTTKTESWTSEAIEEYLLNNNREETLRLGLLNEEDVAMHEAKMDGSRDVTDNRNAAPPELLVNDEARPTTPGPSSRKRQAPIPPQRKSPSWRPQDIENYLLEHNMNENLRLGLLSQEDIQIYEWKRATVASELQVRRAGDSHPPPSGMSPICDTSWTRETLRKNKVVRGSSSSSLSSSVTPSPEMQRPSVSSPDAIEERKSSERAIDVPSSPLVKPARRRARAPPPPPFPSVTRTFPATTSTPTSARKVSGHFAFRGFKLGQRVGKGVGDGISRLGQAVGDRVSAGASSQAKPGSPPEVRPEVKPEAKKPEVTKTTEVSRPEVTKTEVSRPKKLVLDRIGVKLPGLTSRDTSPAAAGASESSGSAAGTPVTDEAAPVGEAVPGAQQRRRETPYRKLARLLGKEPPAKAPAAPPAVVPSHALFLREAPRATAASIQDDEESGIRKKLSDMRLRLGWLRRRGEGQVSVRPQPEEAQGWAESFHNLMASKYGQALFKAFLQREFSEENVEFWLAVEDFKKTRSAKMPSKASKIHSDYVAVQAPKEINLDPGTRAQIAKSLDCPDKFIFDAAQKRVQALMESDAYLRFLQSELYKELLHPESSPSNPDAL